MPAHPVVKLPRSISYETGAAMMLKGMTVQYLFRRTYKLQKGQTILFHAAAGGVGLIAMQWAKALGVTVIGTVGSAEKAALARKYGCDHTILYNTENVVERVREITGGKMVPVVYDSVGKDTFEASLDSPAALRPDGELRQRVGRGAAGVADRAQGLALHHASVADGAHRQSQQPRGDVRAN